MDVPRTSRSTQIGLLGCVLLAAGVYLPWLTQAGGTLEQVGPWELAGFQPARAVLLVPLLAVFVLRASGRLARFRLILVAGIGVASVVVPPLRLLQAVNASGVHFVPDLGFFLTALSGPVLVAAATLAWTERRRSATNDEQSSAVRAPARERQ
ncbi:hypothetical protein SAMN05216559_4176 [Halomicrobium zhouii]|uniref:Uncharacterized protein n=1 Tax=Halomicrobium zhouii TaxID=767519 RepID=A0A1I6MBF7_9EURY|nr:hypothetical protein [Halomicrobium zhouii]SFS13001.1 hypothetical protein SAMN05216559_4176 [Halomicrobium zhouii]